MEKTGEELTYHQGATNVTRMDYLSPFFNELGLLASRSRSWRASRCLRAPPGSGC